MTICAAAISQSIDSPHCIISVCDRKVSMAELTAEGVAWKLQTVHAKWRAMFSGDNSSMIALMDAVKAESANAKGDNVRSFARICSRAYREERERILESEVLAEHDVKSYAEYLELKKSDRDFFQALTDQIKEIEQKWNLLFFGFDSADRPHIFVITEYGKIQWCDAEGFAAIGSGAWGFWTALSRYGFNRYAPRGETMWGVLAAKFAAESAEGVGEETVFLISKHSDRLGDTIPGLVPDDIKQLRAKWKSLPRIPDGADKLMEGHLAGSERTPPFKVSNPLRGYLRRSVPRKSKRER
ncbi:MAG: hypothetical protein WAM13_19025 [Candidatus Sulfotelmatobacter sp.]